MSRLGLRRNVLTVIGNGTEPADRAIVFLARHPKLAVFPVFSLLGTLVVSVGFFLGYHRLGEPIWYWFISLGFGPFGAVAPTAYVLVWLFLTTFVAVLAFSNAALAHNTNLVADGRSPSLKRGILVAFGVLPHVFTYAAVTGGVGVVVAVLERRAEWMGALLAALLGMTYVMVTFFVVPAAVVGDRSPVGMFDESAKTVRSHVGRTATVSMGVSLLLVNIFAIPLFIAIVLVTINGALGIVSYPALIHWGAGVLGVTPDRAEVLGTIASSAVIVAPMWVGIVLGSSLSTIAKTSLYLAIHEERETLPLLDIDRGDVLFVADSPE